MSNPDGTLLSSRARRAAGCRLSPHAPFLVASSPLTTTIPSSHARAAFLNKKSWHTGGIPMQAEVWKREQEKAYEDRKLEEMRKEIAEERKLQELQMQAAEAGHIDKVERLEFMYKGGPMTTEADTDAYLLGERKFEAPKEEDEMAKVASAPGSLLADGPAARNETWNKLNADPLLMMRMREQEARKSVTQNPVKMAQIKREVAELREKKKARKREKKEAKKASKRAKKEAIREEVRRKVLGERGYADAKARESRGRRGRSPSSSSSSRSRSRSRSRSWSPARMDRGADAHRRERGRKRSRSPGRDRRAMDGDKGGGVRDGASAQDGAKGYGLTYANRRAEDAAAVRRERRNEWRESTREEREAAEEEERRAKEQAWARAGGKNRVGHRTGKLSEEEKAARLAAMMSDANAHDEARNGRLMRHAREEDASGEGTLADLAAGAQGRHHSDPAPFLERARKDAFGGSGAPSGGLEDRIGTTKYYTQRGGDGDSSYRR